MPAKPSSRRAARSGQVTPTKRERRLAAEASRLLPPTHGNVNLRMAGAGGTQVELPAVAVRLLRDVLSHLASGNAVAVVPTPAELTTHQSAAILGVSRPFLIKALDAGHLKYRMVGTHRRILLAELIAYRDTMDGRRHAALDELTRQAQELGMGY